MVKLTEEMVVARTRQSDFSAIKKLNCWGTELTDVSIIREMKNVEVLSLSVNRIDSLHVFQYCLNLQDLFIRKNSIKDLNEICYLQGLSNLRNLWLGENPCAEREGYRTAVLRALPNLKTLDDKVVTNEEVQIALTKGRILVHPWDMEASPPPSGAATPEDIVSEYIDEPEIQHPRRYSTSSTVHLDHQRSDDARQQLTEEYRDPDRRNANYNSSPPHHCPQNNQYVYTDYDDRQVLVSKQNGDYEERRRPYSTDYSTNEAYPQVTSRTQYPNDPVDERRSDKSYDYDDESRPQSPPHPPLSRKATSIQHLEKEEMSQQVPGWVRHSDKDKCKSQFHYHRRPVTRNSNILSAVLCLVKELDYPSLEVVEMAVRNRMDELEE